MGKRRLIYLFASTLVLIIATVAGRYALQKDISEVDGSNGSRARFYRVAEVHDGDTVTALIGGRMERIRLIGIDAPEMGQRPWGLRAKNHLVKLLMATNMEISLELDVQERDKYGRLLAYLRAKDGSLINLRMVEDGYAFLYTIPPNVKYVDVLRTAETSARKGRRGIWGAGGLRQKPSEYRKLH